MEKYNRLVNLDHNADFTAVEPVEPGQTGTYEGRFQRSLVNPDRAMYFAAVWDCVSAEVPRSLLQRAKQTVIRGGYGINYNTGQYATIARSCRVPAAVRGDADEIFGGERGES